MVISHVSYFHIRTNPTLCFITGNLQTHLRKTEQKWPQKESHILYKLKVLKDADHLTISRVLVSLTRLMTPWEHRTARAHKVLGFRTSFGAEAEAFVRVVVFGRGAPAVAVVPAGCGAPVILLSLKGEWEFTRSSLGVTPQGEEHCKRKRSAKYRRSIHEYYTYFHDFTLA